MKTTEQIVLEIANSNMRVADKYARAAERCISPDEYNRIVAHVRDRANQTEDTQSTLHTLTELTKVMHELLDGNGIDLLLNSLVTALCEKRDNLVWSNERTQFELESEYQRQAVAVIHCREEVNSR